MQTILTAIISFVLTGVVGNKLLQAWQARYWMSQQRFIGQEKEYNSLKDLADEIATLLGTRIYAMQRIVLTLSSDSLPSQEKITGRRYDYEESTKKWNERLTSFLVRLPVLSEYEFAARLENRIQRKMARIGRSIDTELKNYDDGTPQSKERLSNLRSELLSLQGSAISFNKDLLNSVISQRVDIYYGKKIKFSEENLHHFSTWQLIKALFIRDINSHSVVRTPLNS